MARYPNYIYDPRTKENKLGVEYDPTKTTVGFAEDTTKLDQEVMAIQTNLGVGGVAGDKQNLKERLEVSIGADGKLKPITFDEELQCYLITNQEV